MNSLRITVMMILALAIPVQLTVAQQGPGGPGGAAPSKEEVVAKLEKIAAELQLSPQQRMQMLPILKDEALKVKALKENTSLGPIQKLAQLKQVDSETDGKVMPILSPIQQQKWQALRQQERQELVQKFLQKGAQ